MGLFFVAIAMVQRVTYRRRHCYNTKAAKGPSCGDCGISLPGIAHLRPKQYQRIPKNQKTVSRAYGGSRCGGCVRQRILRAFLVEEQREAKTSALQAARAEAKQKQQQAQKGGKTTGKKARK